MSSSEIGNKLVALCKQGKNLDAVNTLYSPEIVSIEAVEMPGMPTEMKGIDAVRKKNIWWYENHQVHSASAEGPFPNGDRFAVYFKYDVSSKKTGERMKMDEVALYTTRNGKIVKEEFFYSIE